LRVKDKEAYDMIQIKHRYTGRVIKAVDAASLANADLQFANLRGADLRGADLRGAKLRGAKLQCAALQNADLQHANLQGADLWNANLRGANLRGANLQLTDLQFAKLRGSYLLGSNLGGAKLRNANLQLADLQYANLQVTDIRWVFGDGKRIKTIDDHYRIVIMPEYGVMAIGCEQHSIDEWMNFSDEEIDKMDTSALQWWKVWKPRIQQIIDG
jgi:hypothetical protein